MNKSLKAFLSLALVLGGVGAMATSLAGCSFTQGGVVQSSDRNIVSINVDETSLPSVIYIGEFNEAGIKLLVTYSDGTSETIPVTTDFIPAAYQHYLEKPGEWKFTLYYRGATTEIPLKIDYHYFTVDFYALVTTSTLEKISTQSIKKGEAATAPTDVVQSLPYEHILHTFKGWDVDFSQITSDLKVTANYDEETIYWVSFYNGANTLIKKEYVKNGQDAIAPTAEEAAMSGYDFIGWDRPFTAVNKDLDVYGLYTQITPAVTTTWTGSVSAGFQGGLYPQTVVEDATLINALSAITTVNGKGYLEYEGNQYAKAVGKVNGLSFSSKSGTTTFQTGSTYYFKVEPIQWRVLSSSSTSVTLLSEYDLHAMAFDADSNNYKDSEIRQWLNNDFYNQAFNAADQAKILTTTVDNSLSSTLDSSNPYVCENTEDKVFVLSRRELSFVSGSYAAIATDYARVRDAYMYNGYCGWWLRSPRPASATAKWIIGYVGDVYSGTDCMVIDTCARPALTLSLA